MFFQCLTKKHILTTDMHSFSYERITIESYQAPCNRNKRTKVLAFFMNILKFDGL